MSSDQYFWVGQKAFIRKGDEVLVFSDLAGELHFPGGKIQEGETNLTESLQREVMEESGLKIEVKEPFAVWQTSFPDHHKYFGEKIYFVGFRCEYVSGEVAISNEHNKFKWVNKDNYHEVDDGTQYFKILENYFNS